MPIIAEKTTILTPKEILEHSMDDVLRFIKTRISRFYFKFLIFGINSYFFHKKKVQDFELEDWFNKVKQDAPWDYKIKIKSAKTKLERYSEHENAINVENCINNSIRFNQFERSRIGDIYYKKNILWIVKE